MAVIKKEPERVIGISLTLPWPQGRPRSKLRSSTPNTYLLAGRCHHANCVASFVRNKTCERKLPCRLDPTIAPDPSWNRSAHRRKFPRAIQEHPSSAHVLRFGDDADSSTICKGPQAWSADRKWSIGQRLTGDRVPHSETFPAPNDNRSTRYSIGCKGNRCHKSEFIMKNVHYKWAILRARYL